MTYDCPTVHPLTDDPDVLVIEGETTLSRDSFYVDTSDAGELVSRIVDAHAQANGTWLTLEPDRVRRNFNRRAHYDAWANLLSLTAGLLIGAWLTTSDWAYAAGGILALLTATTIWLTAPGPDDPR
jgi:hypothetical protein